jgi:hypothetical protein
LPGVVALIVAGFHVPVKLFVDVTGKPGAVLFWHKGPICVKVGVAAFVICMAIVAVVAQCPAAGVKVYVVVPTVVVLIVAGFQVPGMLLFDVGGSAGAVVFWVKGPI